ncbi:MAG: DUF423 domain-containing protein [Brevundimonas sp.]|uniref:DUF423 domain-containing protein n=1 Tax=Brevundimonas sp. TaxID=1871086 RepID=UPI002ABBF016|nr:DUF423 domain-containing protein [Brevundimonas sp.]MDZ4112440.1 DUF423 domain-containing protein [Brevundimonas sp.]
MMVNRTLAVTACGLGALCVLLGAFAAHGAGPQVKTLLTTGAHYGLIHALLAVVAAAVAPRSSAIRWAGWLAVVGGAVFALSLTLVGMAGLSVMGAVAPIGGLLMVSAWLLFAFGVLRMRPSDLS